jgi:SAM-dependent methyltransferase
MSALPPKADIVQHDRDVRFVPKADIRDLGKGKAIIGLPFANSERNITMSDFSAFAELERRSWSDATRASSYVELFAAAPDQAIDHLLDAAGARRDSKVLDLCCGQGNVSEALLSRDCHVVGVDFSPAMLAFARKRVRNAIFIEADAQELPFDDAEFDIVVSNLGVCHVPDQSRALAEAQRVLRSGGKFAMTVVRAGKIPLLCGCVPRDQDARSPRRLRAARTRFPPVRKAGHGCEAFIGGGILKNRYDDR